MMRDFVFVFALTRALPDLEGDGDFDFEKQAFCAEVERYLKDRWPDLEVNLQEIEELA